jgi:hypothetical protein
MKKYIGVKQVTAIEMNIDGAMQKEYRTPSAGLSAGYEVTYEDGYKSWSPKNVFEDSYIETGVGVVLGKALKEYELRVVRELEDLSDKLSKLRADLPKLKKQGVDTSDLKQQAIIMQAYLDILVKRLNSFGVE